MRDKAKVRDIKAWRPDASSGLDIIQPSALPELKAIFQKYAQTLGLALRRMSGRDVSINFQDIETRPYGGLEGHWPEASLFHVVRLEEPQSPGLLVMPAGLVALFSDVFHGGGDRRGVRSSETFTVGEVGLRLARRITVQMLTELEQASGMELGLRFTRQERALALTGIMPEREAACASAWRISINGQSERFYFVVPTAVAKRLDAQARIARQRQEQGQSSAPALGAALPHADVAVVARFGEADVTARDVMNLAVGDVIQLDRRPDEALQLLVEGVPKLSARVGTVHGHRAVKIVK